MRLITCRPSILILSAAIFLSIHAPAWASCATRHFYNYSDVTFTIQFSDSIFGSGAGRCNVGDSPMEKTCQVPPGQVAELHYPNLMVTGNERVTFSSPVYSENTFWFNADCYISHRGNTGNIVVNDSADGDVKTCGHNNNPNGYDCR